jgi:hypothetical protein
MPQQNKFVADKEWERKVQPKWLQDFINIGTDQQKLTAKLKEGVVFWFPVFVLAISARNAQFAVYRQDTASGPVTALITVYSGTFSYPVDLYLASRYSSNNLLRATIPDNSSPATNYRLFP